MGDTMRGFDMMFIHPKGNAPAPIDGEGALIELVKAPPEGGAAFDALATQLTAANLVEFIDRVEQT